MRIIRPASVNSARSGTYYDGADALRRQFARPRPRSRHDARRRPRPIVGSILGRSIAVIGCVGRLRSCPLHRRRAGFAIRTPLPDGTHNGDGIPDWIARALRQTDQASSFARETTPARGWSTPRLLLGVGLAAFGAYWAVHERRCRGTGWLNSAAPSADHSVGASPDARVLYANLNIGYGNAREPSVTRRGGVCDIDWVFDSQEIWTDNSVLGRPLTYRDPDTLQPWTFSTASAAPGPPTDAILQNMRNSFAPEEYIPKENLYVGIAAAAAGGIVAAFFSRTDTPVDVTPIPAGARLSLNFGF